ncbi:SGNH/GDSL hydrolase family protein [Kribbella deserti]|uniref:SGNH/GDSL hydrolase family protein n=1 Tax=Kribbella deserti TaxID=1926257 RepID=A0ABV6QQX3_9ACTN
MSTAILDPRGTIVFAGDSVTDCGRRDDRRRGLGNGYVRQLTVDLGSPAPRVLNTGISGNRAVDLVRRWQTDVLAHQPDVVSILIGINDTWRRYDKADPTSTEAYEASYRQLLAPLRTAGARIVLMEPFLLAVKPEQHEWREDLDPKIAVVRRLATEYGAVLVPTDAELNLRAESLGPIAIADDGVHPTALGHRLIAEIWRSTVLRG